MAHAKVPEYGSLLSRLRLRNQTWSDFETFNKRLIDKNDPLWPVHEELAKVQEKKKVIFPVACLGNNSRHSTNWLRVKICLIQLKENRLRLMLSCVQSGNMNEKTTHI